jgi:hypothetical protein
MYGLARIFGKPPENRFGYLDQIELIRDHIAEFKQLQTEEVVLRGGILPDVSHVYKCGKEAVDSAFRELESQRQVPYARALRILADKLQNIGDSLDTLNKIGGFLY